MAITKEEAEIELSNLLEKDKLCIFAGSGVSVNRPSNLPTWDGFVNKYSEICREICEKLGDKKYDGILDDVEKYKKRDVITTITALRDIVSSYEKSGEDITFYDAKFGKLFSTEKYNNYHKAIVETNYKYILTTNYDFLLEYAAEKNGYNSLKQFSSKHIEKISAAIYKKESAIIHMHGTYKDMNMEEFILTKEDYKRIKEKNPGFRTLMNSIFMNYSILFVGYGSSDPHLEDIIDEININLKWLGSGDELELPKYYLLIKKDKLSPIFDHVKNKNRTKVIPVGKYDDMLTLLEKLQKKHPRKPDTAGETER